MSLVEDEKRNARLILRELASGRLTVRDGMGAITFELTAGHRDGSDHDYLPTKHPVCNAEGTVVGAGRCHGGWF